MWKKCQLSNVEQLTVAAQQRITTQQSIHRMWVSKVYTCPTQYIISRSFWKQKYSNKQLHWYCHAINTIKIMATGTFTNKQKSKLIYNTAQQCWYTKTLPSPLFQSFCLSSKRQKKTQKTLMKWVSDFTIFMTAMVIISLKLLNYTR